MIYKLHLKLRSNEWEVVMSRQRVAVGALAAFLVSSVGNGAKAEEMHAITCIINKTNVQISYEIKYGEGGYRPESLAAGYETSYHQPASTAEPITIRYDADLRPGSENRTMQTYKSHTASGKLCALGHIYNFEIDPATTLLKLYDTQ